MTALVPLPTLDDEPSAPSMREQMLTVEQLRTMPRPRHLIRGLLDLDSLVFLYGPRDSYKSFLAVDLCASVATGTRWQDREIAFGTVLYVAAEGHGGLTQRFDAWESAHRMTKLGDRLHVYPKAVNLLSPASVGELITAASDYMTNLVVFDTLARCMVGGDESTSRDAGIAIEQLDHIKRATGACVIAVHHSGKDIAAGARGSSAFEAAADTVLQVTASDGVVTMKMTKQKNHPAAMPIRMRARPVGASVVLDGHGVDDDSVSESVWETLAALASIDIGNGVSSKDWETAANEMAEKGRGSSTFHRHRKLLVDRGEVSLTGDASRGRYQVSDLGNSQLPSSFRALP